MKTSLLATVALVATCLLAACGYSEDIPTYTLPDDISFREYQGNEEVVLAIEGSFSDGADLPLTIEGELFVSWRNSSADKSGISALQNTPLFTETCHSNAQQLADFYLERHFWQNNGQLMYAGIKLQSDGNTYWAAETGQTPQDGIAGLGDSDATPPADQTYDLWLCNNGTCTQKVATVTQTYHYRGIDKIKTPYAFFETLRYQSVLTIDGDANHPEMDINLAGQFWYYPPLGPVKVSFSLTDNNDLQTTFINVGLLAATDVALPEPAQ